MNSQAPRSGGFTLLEVLVAVLLLSLGLLGLASLQAWGLRTTGSATHRSQATLLANDMVERMRANLPAVAAGSYNKTSINCGVVPARCQTVAHCTTEELATADYFAVMCGGGSRDGAGLDDILPQGTMVVNCTGTECRVTLGWVDLADKVTQANKDDTTSTRESALQLVFVP